MRQGCLSQQRRSGISYSLQLLSPTSFSRWPIISEKLKVNVAQAEENSITPYRLSNRFLFHLAHQLGPLSSRSSQRTSAHGARRKSRWGSSRWHVAWPQHVCRKTVGLVVGLCQKKSRCGGLLEFRHRDKPGALCMATRTSKGCEIRLLLLFFFTHT